jgi:hypothetical protein
MYCTPSFALMCIPCRHAADSNLYYIRAKIYRTEITCYKDIQLNIIPPFCSAFFSNAGVDQGCCKVANQVLGTLGILHLDYQVIMATRCNQLLTVAQNIYGWAK